MIKSWDAFIAFLVESNDCDLIDDLDWGYPIYRCSSTGRECGLDLNCDIDDFMICSICERLGIEPPKGNDTNLEVARAIRKNLRKGK